LNGGQISNAYLDGAGTFATNATNGDQFGNVTTGPAVAVASNSSADRFVNFTNGGAFTFAVIPLVQAITATMTGFVNQGSGSITMVPSSQLNAANFQSYGLLTIFGGGTGPYATLLTNTGTSPLYFNGGSRT